MSPDRAAVTATLLAAQIRYRTAVARHREENSEESRKEVQAAQRQLDELQRVAVHATAHARSSR